MSFLQNDKIKIDSAEETQPEAERTLETADVLQVQEETHVTPETVAGSAEAETASKSCEHNESSDENVSQNQGEKKNGQSLSRVVLLIVFALVVIVVGAFLHLAERDGAVTTDISMSQKHQNPNTLPIVTIQCTQEENSTLDSLNKQCIFTNLCMNSTHGIYARFPVDQDSIKALGIKDTNDMPPISMDSYIDKGMKPQFFFPEQYDLETPWNPPNPDEKRVLFIWAPAAYPQEPPFHFLVNNMMPFYRTMLMNDSERFLPENEWHEGRVFRDEAHVLWGMSWWLKNGGFWKQRQIDFMEFLQLGHTDLYIPTKKLMQKFELTRDTQYPKLERCVDCGVWHTTPNCSVKSVGECVCSHEPICCESGWKINCVHTAVRECGCQLPKETENICYNKVIAGLGGTHAHFTTNYIGGQIYPQELYDKFRATTLAYYGCTPKPQSEYERPKVLLIQRRPSGNDPTGRRVFRDIDDKNYLLYSLNNQGKIDYESYKYFEQRDWRNQICTVAETSILLAYHGAALGHIVFMEAGSVLFEVTAGYRGFLLRDLAIPRGLKYFRRFEVSFNETVIEAYRYWWDRFKQMDVTL